MKMSVGKLFYKQPYKLRIKQNRQNEEFKLLQPYAQKIAL